MRELLAQLKGAPLSVFCSYASHANNKDGYAWPSLRLLCRETGYGLRSVKAARRLLVGLGVLVASDQERAGGKFGRRFFRLSAVVQKGYSGTVVPSAVVPSTAVPSTVVPQMTQEGTPSEGTPSEGSPGGREDSRKSGFAGLRSRSATYKNKSLEKNLSRKLGANDLTLRAYLDKHPGDPKVWGWWERVEHAFAAMRYRVDIDSPLVGVGFVSRAVNVWMDRDSAGLLPGILCSRVIDLCAEDGVVWPPDFQAHRDRLRKEERKLEEVAANENR